MGGGDSRPHLMSAAFNQVGLSAARREVRFGEPLDERDTCCADESRNTREFHVNGTLRVEVGDPAQRFAGAKFSHSGYAFDVGGADELTKSHRLGLPRGKRTVGSEYLLTSNSAGQRTLATHDLDSGFLDS